MIPKTPLKSLKRLVPRSGVEPLTHRFSEVADAANINDLAEGDWQKPSVACHSRPLAIDLFCGLGGWTDGLLAERYDVVGFDIERHEYGERQMPEAGTRKVGMEGVDFNNPNEGSAVNRSFNYANECVVRDAPLTGRMARYPGQLVVQDVLTLHGSQFKDADLIVASPPCQEYSYMAMPWTRAKAKAAAIRADESGKLLEDLNRLFHACFRIQAQASIAAGRKIPLIVENVRGAQPWVGRARWNFGSFYLWGDVPALMPMISPRAILKPQSTERRHGTGSWFAIDMKSARAGITNPAEIVGQKVPGFRFDGSGRSFRSASVEGIKGVPHRTAGHWTNPAEHEGAKQAAAEGFVSRQRPGMTENSGGNYWFQDGSSSFGSKTSARKQASAMIAKIPLPLARHIARVYAP
jgi:hypothetical protein